LFFDAMQSREERARLYLKRALGDLLNAARGAQAVRLPRAKDLRIIMSRVPATDSFDPAANVSPIDALQED
jgi:hypothetical protein